MRSLPIYSQATIFSINFLSDYNKTNRLQRFPAFNTNSETFYIWKENYLQSVSGFMNFPLLWTILKSPGENLSH